MPSTLKIWFINEEKFSQEQYRKERKPNYCMTIVKHHNKKKKKKINFKLGDNQKRLIISNMK